MHAQPPLPLALLRCPACRHAPLSALEDGALRCPECGRRHPAAGGLPLLMQRPDAELASWGDRLAAFVAETEHALTQLSAELLEAELIERTRARLQLVIAALGEHRDRIVDLCAKFGVTPGDARAADASLLAYYTSVHRDFAWTPESPPSPGTPEAREPEQMLDALLQVLPKDFELGSTLVLGAGTARLAWDLLAHLGSKAPVLALDVNPLPYFVSRELMNGASLRLYELPGHPRRSTFSALERSLSAPRPAPPNLHLLFADALDAPVPDGAFDTVLTPWFVDQVPADAATLLPKIRRWLRPGGAWLNHGPFIYDPSRTKAAHRYAADEFIQLAKAHGFEISKASYELRPHFASPASSQARHEWVLTFHATSGETVRAAAEPAWLGKDGLARLPVPSFPGLEDFTAPHPTLAAVARAIDGQKTASQLTALLIAQGVIAEDEHALTAVRGCLRLLWQSLGSQK